MTEPRPRLRRLLATALLVPLLAAGAAVAQDMASFEKNLTVHKLPNGLTFLIYRRPTAPVVSFFTLANVGAAQEVPGITGIAHMFEHMAFKGTSVIGTTDYKSEKAALAKVDEAYHAYDAERQKLGGPDAKKLDELKKAWKDAQEAADKFIKKNEFGEIIDREGGVGLNAFTNSDETGYFYSLPANKLELWAYLESERFLDPVFREFYKERDVVMEERRLRTESQPIGRLIEQFIAMAYIAHPYKQPVVGYMSDLMSFSREDAERFFHTYYIPSNLVIAIVGDVNADQAIPVLDKYFERLPSSPPPPTVRTVEPKQIVEKSLTMPDKSQPVYIEGYHRPAATDPDDAVYNVMADILSQGRTSRMYKNLVRDKKIAAAAGAFNGFPGEKYPNMMIFFAIPTPGHTGDEVQKEIRDEIHRIQTEPVSADELARVKTQAKAALIRGLGSNQGLANQLAVAQTLYGDWREIFRSVERIDKVTQEDVMRVAKATFVPTNRTVGSITTTDAAATH